MTTAIICGGRSYGIVPKNCPTEDYTRMQQLALDERHRLSVILREARERLAVTKMVMGDQTGADHLAVEWCKGNGMPFQVYEADWSLPNFAGGPIRNLKMIRAEMPPPTICIAFPGAKGTKNMCKQAQENFLRVIPIDWRWPS